ncbi:RNA polymerase sigma factor [Larkinella soli]|uniref:RNA polymerase sigma factor n=1 Tax=Larkinella soli TaxID=1770527 RepID=UPI001E5BE317|nr:RNA polymerase sigma factor [Larkinella soli]
MEVLTDCSVLERQLIEGCRRGEARAQERLFRHFYGFAMGICLRYAVSRQEAQEILNDSFLKVFDAVSAGTDVQSFRAWLRRIVVNTALDRYRRTKRRAEVEVQEEESEAAVGEEAVDRLTVEEILALLDQLPDEWRLVFNLYEIEGYPHEEIGRMLSIPAGSSRTYLARAKKRLRRLIQQWYSS